MAVFPMQQESSANAHFRQSPARELSESSLLDPSMPTLLFTSTLTPKKGLFRKLIHSRSFLALFLLLAALILTAFLLVRLTIHDDHIEDDLDASVDISSQPMFYKVNAKTSGDQADLPLHYMIAIDAGSTATRAYVFSWHDDKKSKKLPTFELSSSLELWPALSKLPDQKTVRIYMQKLLKFCADTIQDPEISKKTPVYFYATAGLRLLSESKQKTIMGTVFDTVFQSPYGFLIRPEQVQIISGELEGALAWLSINFMTDGLKECSQNTSNGKYTSTGLVDIGGGSMQVAYEVENTDAVSELLTNISLTLQDGTKSNYRIFSKSILGFGMNEARKQYHETYREKTWTETQPPYPLSCYHLDFIPFKGEVLGLTDSFIGSGDFSSCYNQVNTMLKGAARAKFNLLPLKQKGQQRLLPFPKTPMQIYGISEVWYTVEDIFHMGTNSTKIEPFKASELFKISEEFCQRSWHAILSDVENKKIDVSHERGASVQDKLRNQCFKSSWVISLMDLFFDCAPTSTSTSTSTSISTSTSTSTASSRNPGIQIIPKNTISTLPLTWAWGVPILYYSTHHSKK